VSCAACRWKFVVVPGIVCAALENEKPCGADALVVCDDCGNACCTAHVPGSDRDRLLGTWLLGLGQPRRDAPMLDAPASSERRLHRMHTDFAKLRRAAQAAVAPGATLDTIAELRRVLEEIG